MNEVFYRRKNMSNCPNCGNVSKSGEKFCMVCGYRFPEQPQQSYQQQMPYQNVNQYQQTPYYGTQGQYQNASKVKAPKSGKKFPVVPVVIGIIALILVVVGAFVGIKLFGSKSPEDSVEKLCRSFQENDEDLFNECMNTEFMDMINSGHEAYLTVDRDTFYGADSLFERETEQLENTIGDIEEVTYKIKDQEEIDADEVLEDMLEGNDIEFFEERAEYVKNYKSEETYEAYQDWLDSIRSLQSSIEDADEILKFEVRLKFKGDNGNNNNTSTFYLLKKDGKWSIIVSGYGVLSL